MKLKAVDVVLVVLERVVLVLCIFILIIIR